jgi:hypothetical protein
VRLPLHVSVHMYDHFQGAREQYFVQLLNWITFMYVRCVHNERTSTESKLVTAQITAHEPPEDGRTYGPKHEGATSLKCF